MIKYTITIIKNWLGELRSFIMKKKVRVEVALCQNVAQMLSIPQSFQEEENRDLNAESRDPAKPLDSSKATWKTI